MINFNKYLNIIDNRHSFKKYLDIYLIDFYDHEINKDGSCLKKLFLLKDSKGIVKSTLVKVLTDSLKNIIDVYDLFYINSSKEFN